MWTLINDAYQTISDAASKVLIADTLHRNPEWTEQEFNQAEKRYKENIEESKREFKEQNANDLFDCKESVLQQLKMDKEEALEELSSADPDKAAHLIKQLQGIFRRRVDTGIDDMKTIRDRVFDINNFVREHHVQHDEPLDSPDEYNDEFFPDLRYEAIFALGKVTSHNTNHQGYCSGMESAGYDDSFNQFSGCVQFAKLP